MQSRETSLPAGARRLAAVGSAIAVATVGVPASAQVAAEAAIQTDYRVRGYSISNGDPAASLLLSYDDPSGVYIGGTVVASIDRENLKVAGIEADAGYALRVSSEISLDLGVSRSEYYYAYDRGGLKYTELYLGLSTPHLTGRVSYSPETYRAAAPSLYAEVESGIEPATDWFLSAHAGLFRYLDRPRSGLPRERLDWRIGATRQLGRTGLHLILSGRVQGGPAGRASDGTAAVLSLTRAF